MSGPRLDWDDARLGAAFAARQARVIHVPSDLVGATLDRIGRVATASAPGRLATARADPGGPRQPPS